jgi:hypothetical protein
MINNLHDDIALGSHGGNCDIREIDTLFIQYNCKVGDEELLEKREQALMAGCVEVFAALTLLSVVAYRQGSINIEKKEFDLQTVTASDYALEVKLSREQIDQMKRDIYQNSFEYYENPGYQLKFWVKKLFEDKLKELSGRDGFRIADINFAYHNSWLIDGLRTRGDAIQNCDWPRLNQLNEELTQRIHSLREDGSSEISWLVMPKCAFVSFESEEGYNFMAEMSSIELAGFKSKMSEAPEPTNVIWENRDFDK